MIKQGKDIKEIIKELKKVIPQVHLYLMVKDPKWIEASGRISHFAAGLLRKMAEKGIRPLLTLRHGRVFPVGLMTGARDILLALFKQFEKEVKELKKIRVAITHGDDLRSAKKLKKMIEKRFKTAKVVFINIIDNIIGAPIGPDALICAWYKI